MAKQTINVGTSANDATGDTLRSGAIKINSNFTELYQSNTSVFDRLIAGSHITLSKVGNNCTINAVVSSYTLPNASTNTLGGVKVDGTSITINGSGVISTPVYSLPVASNTTLGGVKVDGNTITISNGIISSASAYTLPVASNSTLGGVKIDGTTITISDGVISGVGRATRTVVSNTTTPLAGGATTNLTIVGAKGYLLYKVQVSTTTGSGAWVRIYTNDAARTADASRSQSSDPTIQGVIAEVVTVANSAVVPITPGVVGFNDETSPTTNIELAVTNTSLVTGTITVTLTILPLEA